MNISNITGSPVAGDDFFDREWESDKLQRSLIAGNNVLLTAPRRVGKSSLMHKTLEWAQRQGWFGIHADVQDCDHEAIFLEKITDAFAATELQLSLLDEIRKPLKKLKKFLAGSKFGPVEITAGEPEDWREATGLFEKYLEQFGKGTTRVLFGLDELPIFLTKLKRKPNGLERVELVLNWLRALRDQTPKKVNWIICGSVGLDTFVEQHNLAGTINNLQIQKLGPFTEATAIQFLKTLGASPHNPLSINDEVAESILNKVGWPLPYYLQLLFHALRELHPDRRSSGYPGTEDVVVAYDELLTADYSSYFAHWHTRLKKEHEIDLAENALFLLKHIANQKRGVSSKKLHELLSANRPNWGQDQLEHQFGLLLDLLERDGYLQRKKSTYAFRSFLLRDYWKRHFLKHG